MFATQLECVQVASDKPSDATYTLTLRTQLLHVPVAPMIN